MEDNLKNLGVAYPSDDGLPTPDQLVAIGRIVPQDMELITVSSLFDEPCVQPRDVADTGKSKKLADLKEFDPAFYINSAEDVVLYLKLTLEENDPVALAEALKTIFRSEGFIKLTEM